MSSATAEKPHWGLNQPEPSWEGFKKEDRAEQTWEKQAGLEASRNERSSQGPEPPGHRTEKTPDSSRTRKQAVGEGAQEKQLGREEAEWGLAWVNPVAG